MADPVSSNGAAAMRGWAALLAAEAVAVVFLARSLHTLWARIVAAADGNALEKVTAGSYLTGTAIPMDLAAFLLAIVLLHLAVGMIGFGLAVCTSRAMRPARGRSPAIYAVAWTVALFVWISAANAAQFTWSSAAGGLWAAARLSASGVSVFDVLSVLLGMLIVVIVVRAILTTRAYATAGMRLFVYPAVALAALAAWRVTGLAEASGSQVSARPHVIIIGVDSLRPDVVATGQGAAMTPNIDQFLDEAVRFDDTITPLARTFPSWLTTLTGRHPVAVGARENLLPRDVLKISPTLGDVLRGRGYQAVYATDEVRASNIDESYGFDHVIGPRIGALDFLLGSINDLPLSNLVANTWIGRALFPYTYVNRGAAVTYRPKTFIEEVDRRVDFDRPTFLAVHLTLPHWPYHWADDADASMAGVLRQPYLYSSSVMGADRQFGQLMEMLEREGALSNAIVVLLSDHGEGLGFPDDNLLRGDDGKTVSPGIAVAAWGHGNSVLSPGQYQVLLAWRGFGAGVLSVRPGPRPTPSSLEDVVPTVLDLLQIPHHGEIDGRSLAPFLDRGPADESRFNNRVRFTETGMSVGFTALGEAKVDEVIAAGMSYYGVDPESGRLELKREALAGLIRSKERAAIGRDYVLAALPTGDGSSTFLSVPRAGGVPRVLDGPPDPSVNFELRRLWDALMARYPGELTLPSS